jgi:hypothetical protein
MKQGLILAKESEKSTSLDELDVRKPQGASISQRSGELRVYNMV